MVHATSNTGTALWHIFKVQNASTLRQYIHEAFGYENNEDPIHSQQFSLDPSHLANLAKEYSVVTFTVHQAVGEAVFIPAGCTYQVMYFLLNNSLSDAHSLC